MSDSKSQTGTPVVQPDADAERQPLALDRQLFHLKTLYEATNAMAGLTDPHQILKTFLPVAMGPLGLTFGFGVMLHAGDLLVETVGIDDATREQYQSKGVELVQKFFPENLHTPPPIRPAILIGTHLSNDPNLPVGTNAVMALAIDEGSHVVLGFGPKISGDQYDDDETDLLQGLASTLSATLKKAFADECIRDLNVALRSKNRQMEQALAQSKQAHADLTRHAFQLQALYETSLELSSITDPKATLDAFALTLMGTLSYSSGWIGLYGPNEDDNEVAYRGPDPDDRDRLASMRGREEVLERFVELKDRMPSPNHSTLLEDEGALDKLPAPADVAVLFALDHGWHGAIGLSSPLSNTPLSEENKLLLLSLTSTFIGTLANAKQVRMIQDLNSDLVAQNVELQLTLDKLTTAREEIGIQTEARERIVGLVHGEVDRVSRASWLDVSLIILAGVVLGFLFNLSSPSGIDIIPDSLFEPAPAMVNVRKANGMVQYDQAVIIDARPADFYKQDHITGAINLPKDLFNFVYSMKLSNLDPAVPLLVYGRTISRHYDEDVARELEMLGHETIMVIDGGLSAWEEAGYEVTND